LSGTNTITLNGDIADNTSILTQTINIPLILNATRNVNVTTNGFLRLGGVISDGGGGFGLNKTGAGTLTLLGANTFTGPVTIASGVVSISNDNQLGAVPGAPTANKLVVNGGTINTTANMAINANRGIAVGPAGGAGSSIFDVQTGTTVTYAGVIANNTGSTGGLTKTKFGIMVLSGANTYTGPTAIKNGAVNLDFSAASAPVSNIINSVSTLSIGGETAGLGAANSARLVMTGKASTANTQTFASTNIDLYSSLISLTNGATGGTTTLNLGALTHTLGANLVVTAAAANGSVMTTSSNVNGIIGGWAHAGAVTTTRNIAWAPRLRDHRQYRQDRGLQRIRHRDCFRLHRHHRLAQ
jgi:fibronectin-binding autotransporter adhesin